VLFAIMLSIITVNALMLSCYAVSIIMLRVIVLSVFQNHNLTTAITAQPSKPVLKIRL